jgi:polysaccharide export outer membrane protein
MFSGESVNKPQNIKAWFDQSSLLLSRCRTNALYSAKGCIDTSTVFNGPNMRGFFVKSLISMAYSSVLLFRVALLGLFAGVVAGCASPSGSYPAAPSLAATTDYNYIVGPGDTLNIIVWRNPELSMSVPVRPDGKLSTPLVDELVVQGKTSSQIARDVEKALNKLVRDPVVTVIVSNFVGPYSEQIRVVGEAAKPQALAYKQKMTLLDVMIAVGGLTDFADGNGASITRASEGDKRYSVRLKDLIKRGDISANVEMKPGDVLIIPQGWF